MEHLGRTAKNTSGKWKALYRCECGTEFEALEHNVRRGCTRSCGCLQKKELAARNRLNARHGMCNTPTYFSWRNMKDRCSSPGNSSYEWYGGRGISYDPRWEAFEEFLQDMGESPGKGWSLDKINNDGDYCKENCQWLTKSNNSRKQHEK